MVTYSTKTVTHLVDNRYAILKKDRSLNLGVDSSLRQLQPGARKGQPKRGRGGRQGYTLRLAPRQLPSLVAACVHRKTTKTAVPTPRPIVRNA